MEKTTESYLSLKAAAKVYGISLSKIRAAISANELPVKWVARQALVSRLQLEAWIDRQPAQLDANLLPRKESE
jgi:excisionase family DNA binding protein